MGMKKYRFVGLDKDVWLPDDVYVEIAIVPASVRNVRSNQVFSGQTSYTQHETANFNYGADADMHKRWLHGGAGGEYVGFNFVVDDKKIIQLTPLNEITWAAGTPDGNKYSLHAELCVNSDINHTLARKNAAALAGGIMAAKGWSIDRLFQHNVWWGKDCPYLLRRDGRWTPYVGQVNTFRLAAIAAASGDPAPVPTSSIVKGDMIEVIIDSLNLRQGPGTNYPTTVTLKKGTKATVIGGPIAAGGFVWYDVQGSFGTGFVAESAAGVTHIKEVAAPVPAVFDGTRDVTLNGVLMHAQKRTVRSIGVNEREWASTESPIRKYHIIGAKVAVLGWLNGENVGGESRWWIVSPDGGRIWVGGTTEKP